MYPDCCVTYEPGPYPENPNIDVNHEPGQQFFTTAYYRDQLFGMATQYRILRPDGTVWASWMQTSGADYNASWWWWNWTFGAANPFGTWRFEAVFNGETYGTPFRLGPANPAGAVRTLNVGKTGSPGSGSIVLNWEPGCLYEGEIGSFATHESITCSTGGLTYIVPSPAYENAYYLVVPQNGFREGSYGTDSDGNERPQAAAPCKVQVAGLCPP